MSFVVKESVLNVNNPNADIFEVGTEEGGSDDDNMLSMIGDAVAAHVNKLTPSERQVWEHYTHTADGNIFSRAPSTKFHDRDELNLRNEDLENYFKTYNIPDNMREYVQEAIDAEQDRRAETEDAYDNNEGMISFNEWEEYPQMTKHVDIPTTPRDLMIFSGNSRQKFFDEFPDGHPDTQVLNQFIAFVDRDIDDFNDSYVEFIRKYLDSTAMRDYTRKVLHKAASHLTSTKNHSELISQTLRAIDRNWAKSYNERAIGKTMADPVVKLMIIKNDEWVKLQDSGINPAQQVKEFGTMLFSDFRGRMTSHHWHLYKRLKNKFQTQVFIKGVDINSASIQDLKRITDDTSARKIWFGRPFQSPVEAYTRGFITRQLLTNNVSADKILDVIIRASESAVKNKNLGQYASLATKLVEKQKVANLGIDDASWKNIWHMYRSMRKSVIESLKEETNVQG